MSSFDTKAKKSGVSLCTSVILPASLVMNDTELCSLLSNALENAIAAVSQLEDEKLKKVYIRSFVNENNVLLISTENAYTGEIEMKGGFPKSKNMEAGHGFGIKSIAAIIERHGGLYSIETAGSVFTLKLLLPLEKAEQQ